MIERERAYAEEEERQLTLLIAPELVGSEIGPVTRKPGETDEAYAERSELFALLLKLS
jgi:hypothetical protein